MASPFRLDLLGPLRGWAGDEPIDLGPVRQRSLLAVLALRANQVLTPDELIELVWSDQPPSSGAKIVPPYIYRLRKYLPEGVLDRSRHGYSLKLAPDALDISRFEALVDEAQQVRSQGKLDRAADLLRAALELFTGEPLSGLAGHYLTVQRHRLAERRLKVLAERIELDLGLGRHADLVPELVELVAEDRLREQFAAQLMLAYWRCGRVSEALETYTQTRNELVEQLGVEPGPLLRTTHQRILGGSPSAVPREAGRDELPYEGAAFVGRQEELTRVIDAVTGTAGAAVVTVDGMAGVGKTLLAVRAARQLADNYPDGRLFIDLHGHTPGRKPLTPIQALDRLLRSLSVPPDQIPVDLEERAALWRSELAGRRVLVVLDNAPDTATIKPLLAGSPTTAILVTSRRQLTDLDASARVALDVLSPESAQRLLAELVGDDRVADSDATRQVVAYCGCLPLAIRVASSRLRHRTSWTMEHLRDRLAAEDRRLAELTVDGGGVSPAFALSYDQLSAEQRRMFRLLGLVPGQDVDQYVAAALTRLDPSVAEDHLEQLVDANLLQQPTAGRFTFHDLLRHYAASLAAEQPEPDVMRSLLDYYLYSTAEASYAIFSSRLHPLPMPSPVQLPQLAGHADGLEWVDAEGLNVLAAIHWADAHQETGHAWRIGVAIGTCFYHRSRHDEMEDALEVALQSARRDDDADAEARVLLSLGNLRQYRHGAAASLPVLRAADRALPANADLRLRARLRAALGSCLAKVKPDDEAIAVIEDARRLAQQADDPSLCARALAYLGVAYGDRLDYAAALAAYAESLVFARKANDLLVQAPVLNGIGECLLELDRVEEAIEPLSTARTLAEEQGAEYTLLYSYAFLATAYSRLGEGGAALEAGRKSLELAVKSGSLQSEMNARVRLAEVFLAQGDTAQARLHFARALELATVEGQESVILRAANGLAAC